MANHPIEAVGVDGATVATTEHVGGEVHGEALSFYGIEAGGVVAIAMLVVIAIMLKTKVPALIAAALDKKIAGIRQQLDTAAQLRAEAEALKAEYEKKSRDADKEIVALRAGAEKQAAEIVAKAKQDATDLIARQSAMAEAKIAATERSIISEIRAQAATVATAAATTLLEQRIDGNADRALVDEAISALN